MYRKAEKYGKPSDVIREIIEAFSQDRLVIQPPVAVEVVGDSGIGKTSTILQLAKETDLHFVKLNLAQIEELGDLVGFPIRQFEVCKTENDCLWIDEHAVEEYREPGARLVNAHNSPNHDHNLQPHHRPNHRRVLRQRSGHRRQRTRHWSPADPPRRGAGCEPIHREPLPAPRHDQQGGG